MRNRRNGVESSLRSVNRVVALGKKLGNHLMTLDALGHLTPLMVARGELREAILRCTDAASKYVDGAGELRPLYLAAARDFTQPLFAFGPPRLFRLGMEIAF